MKKLFLLLALVAIVATANSQKTFQNNVFSNVKEVSLSYYSDTTEITLDGAHIISIIGTGIQIISTDFSFTTMDNHTQLKVYGSFVVIPNKRDKRQTVKIIY